MIPFARRKVSAIEVVSHADRFSLYRQIALMFRGQRRLHQSLRLAAFATALSIVLPSIAQEPLPSVLPTADPVAQDGSVQSTPTVTITPVIDLTVPPADNGGLQTSTVTPNGNVQPAESSLIPQEAPLAVPEIQPASGQPQQVVTDTLNPTAPLPQPEAELPPVNADEMADEDRDELLRGPVHEAFAEQFNSDPVPGLVVAQKPPELIEEVPPELKPDGRQVEWISGYWAWDEDQDDFIWVSGIWREVPQGFRWLPGYWTEVEGGYQWVSGTWVSTQTSEINYLNEAPPETLEQGPVGDAPTTEHIWIPGSWMWSNTRYMWRPGYWSTGYSNWVWVPARYQWTPRGYYFCDGYWDYPVARRGVLFAPSHFNRRFRFRRISRFTPRIVVASNLLTAHFWVRPRYRHYYFGNYYDVAWNNRGLTPWHQFPRQRRCFDPIYAHYGRGRNNDYFNQLNVQFNVFVNQPNRRPPVRFRDQDRWVQDHRDFRSQDLLGNRFQNFVNASDRERNGFQFVRLENQQRERVQQETVRLRELVDQRRDVERSLAQLERLRDRENDGGRAGNGPNGLLNELPVGDRRPDRDGDRNRDGESRGREIRERAENSPGIPDGNASEGEKLDGTNPVATDDQRRELRGRDRLKLDDVVPNEVVDRPGKGQDKPDENTVGRPSNGNPADQPQIVDSNRGPDRDKPSSETRELRRRGSRDGLSLETPKNDDAPNPGNAGVGEPSDRRGEKTAGDVGAPIIAGESDAKSMPVESKPVEQDRRNGRERLKLPPVGSQTENAELRGGRTRGNNSGDASQPGDGVVIGNGPETEKSANNGIEGGNGNSTPPVNRRDRNRLNDNSANIQNGIRGRDMERQPDRPALQLPGTENSSGRSVRDNSSRSRQPGGATTSNPSVDNRAGNAAGNVDVTPGTDNVPKLRDSAASRRSSGESSRESAIRRLNPSVERSASGVGPGSPPMGTPPTGAERPSRREATPKIENMAPRTRGSEARSNPAGGAPIRMGNDSPGSAREPKNAPSISLPRGDNGGARNLGPGRSDAGRIDAGRAARPETRAPRMESRSEGRAGNAARNPGGGAPAGGGGEAGGRRGGRERGK